MMNGWSSKLLLSLALCIAGCAKSRGTGDGITETGNPPVLDPNDIALVVTSDAVHIVGADGAITPGGGDIEIENLATGDKQRASVGEDGSFDVQVNGSIDDTYAVRALDGDTDETSAPVYVSRGGATVDTAPKLTCEQRAVAISAELDGIAQGADRSCDSNADCTQLSADVSCPAWVCRGPAVSREGKTALDAEIAAVVEASCVPFQADNCFEGRPLPACITPGPFACVDHQCVACGAAGDCAQTSCAACDTPAIEWVTHMGPNRTVYALTGCKTLTVSPPQGPTIPPHASCTSEPPCVIPFPSRGRAQWSIAQLQNALAEPDVEAALASGAQFGAITPGGFFTEITVGARAFTVHGPCGAAQNCTNSPRDVEELQRVLQGIADDWLPVCLSTP